MCLLQVVIPESTEACRKIWRAARTRGVLLEIFPGFLGFPKGILARLESDQFHQDTQEGNPDSVFVILSDGWTIALTRADIQLL